MLFISNLATSHRQRWFFSYFLFRDVVLIPRINLICFIRRNKFAPNKIRRNIIHLERLALILNLDARISNLHLCRLICSLENRMKRKNTDEESNDAHDLNWKRNTWGIVMIVFNCDIHTRCSVFLIKMNYDHVSRNMTPAFGLFS